jgi:MYXO-CTERM domain-containing protein
MRPTTTIAATASFALASLAHAAVETFDDPVTLSPTQAAGTWYTDRYAPAGFQSGVFFDGGNRLRQTISSADSQQNRPGAYSSSFYDTQGRKFDLGSGITYLSIDLYVDASWETSGRCMAGLWGTAFDAGNAISGYPIIEFNSDGTNGMFRAWNTVNGTWQTMGLPTAFAYNAWYTLEITLSGGMWNYAVGDATWSVSAGSSVGIGNVILQGHNTASGVDYDIYWDNLTSEVPAPGALALLGMGGLLSRRRRAS